MPNVANSDTDRAILADLAMLLAPLLKRPHVTLTRETTAADVDGWDSLVMLTFIFAIETHFEVEFKSGEMDRFECVGDLVDSLRARTRRRNKTSSE